MSSLTQHEAEREKSEKRVHAHLPCRSRVTAVLSDIVRLRACIVHVYSRPVCYICRMCAPEGYTLIRILLGDKAFPQPVTIIQLSTYFLLVLKLNVCRCKGKFYFRILFMAAPRPRKEVPLDSGEEGVRGFPDCIVVSSSIFFWPVSTCPKRLLRVKVITWFH